MNNKWPILIISLPDALDRQQVMRAQLNELGLSGIFVPAIRGSEISDAERAVLYNDFRVRSHSGRSMTAGELGCALSHLKCYDYIISSNADWAVVLEDDSVLPVNFVDVINGLIEREGLIRADLVLLGRIRKFIKSPVVSIDERISVVIPVRAWNANAYLINRKAALMVGRANNPVVYSADDWISIGRASDIVIRGLDNFLCDQQVSVLKSSLERDRKYARMKRRSGRDALLYLFYRLIRRIREIFVARGRPLGRH
ncbi:glycosyltransferase family 25 protein [Perlucidibaca aquatica]|uniref:glycosyltransferase family 25 protein n=1 Tax=Perlucidibaca aquatica TaxID=1852776 RepID=UPI00083B353A|nr:glycosyltransferase family 25 protein [Perlucidibaca aquatica]